MQGGIAELLVANAARTFECSRADVFGRCQQHHIVQARAEVARRLRERGWSLPRIGRVLDRHHTSILHLLRKPLGEIASTNLSGVLDEMEDYWV
jgi:chromosomal replication initiation ATPase DnaA